MATEISEYKGHKTIVLISPFGDKKYNMSFGLSKAKLIMENLEDIKKFIEDSVE